MDYNKEFTCDNITITRSDYESMPCPMNTSRLNDADMQRLAEEIELEMVRWRDKYRGIRVTEDDYNTQLWLLMEHLGFEYGMTYYEDED